MSRSRDMTDFCKKLRSSYMDVQMLMSRVDMLSSAAPTDFSGALLQSVSRDMEWERDKLKDVYKMACEV